MPSARDYVLYSVSRALKGPDVGTSCRSFLLDAVENPGSLRAVAWAASNLPDMVENPNANPGRHFEAVERERLSANGAGLPYWIVDGSLSDTIRIDQLAQIGEPASEMLSGWLGWLDLQSRSEVMLALSGKKVSRLSMELSSAMALQARLRKPLCCAPYVLSSSADDLLLGFSNIMARHPVRSVDLVPTDTVNVYVAQDWRDALMCCGLDRVDKAAGLLGIPACCAKWFAEKWPTCVEVFDGDLAFMSLEECHGLQRAEIPWQCNPYAVYFGGSLLGHFPCSSCCQASIDLVEDRAEWMSITVPSIDRGIQAIQRKRFWFSKDRKIAGADPGSLVGWTRVDPV